MPTMSVVVFSQLLFLAALLFIAGALVLSSGEADYPTDLAEYFTYDGSWGVAALALYNAAVVGSNVLLFDVNVLVPGNLLNMVLAVNTTLVVFARTRRWLIVLTLVYVVVLAAATIVNTPASY